MLYSVLAYIVACGCIELNKHPKFDDKTHPHLDDFTSLSSYIGSNHHKSFKIGWFLNHHTKTSNFGWNRKVKNHPLLEVEHTWSSCMNSLGRCPTVVLLLSTLCMTTATANLFSWFLLFLPSIVSLYVVTIFVSMHEGYGWPKGR